MAVMGLQMCGPSTTTLKPFSPRCHPLVTQAQSHRGKTTDRRPEGAGVWHPSVLHSPLLELGVFRVMKRLYLRCLVCLSTSQLAESRH